MDELEQIIKLAGVNEFKGLKPYGESFGDAAAHNRKVEKERGIKPGDPDWFKLWFSRPYLNGPVQFRGRKK